MSGARRSRSINQAFEGEWSWTILSHEVRNTEVIVHGCLSAGGQTRHAFGGSNITVNNSTGEVISQADDIKAAATDALKKAASTFGIGLELYGGSHDNASESSASRPPLRAVPQHRGQQQPVPDRNRLTAKQLRALYAVAHAAALTDADLKQKATQQYGVTVEFLSRNDASALISSLTTR